MIRRLWMCRPLLCLLGLHATSQRRASTLIKVGGVHRVGERLIAECDRPGCTYSAQIGEAVAVPWDRVRIVPDRLADDA